MKHAKKKNSSSGKSNTDRLSHGKQIAAYKKSLKAQRAEECIFDSTQRADFLTGFHKRKMERRHKAAAKNKEESRTSKLAMRADLREQRRRELAQRMEAYKAALGIDAADGEEGEGGEEAASWSGFSDADSDLESGEKEKKRNKKKKGIWEVNEFDEGDRMVSVQIEEL